ncbi:N-formylglutamate amidohydrolase [Paramagnetospirillum caucaseum]|uniref:N-formylglutamate amidohydrolase n=1 Tax=Paramagnetospirillum caucaseum TaxID=1244869 RepID=M3AEN0_9PROT|nr:N-formylglutamate amidohydrolase [Paramagnetospirillum caucaseum]
MVCDHASAAIPPGLGDLGVDEAVRSSHVAWDIGAARVAGLLAGTLGCPAVLAGISRLVIDCNRQPGDPSSIPPLTCGISVPGNEGVDEAEADGRARDWFWPYHNAIGDRIAHLWRHGTAPAVVAVHSFTPRIDGQAPRPLACGGAVEPRPAHGGTGAGGPAGARRSDGGRQPALFGARDQLHFGHPCRSGGIAQRLVRDPPGSGGRRGGLRPLGRHSGRGAGRRSRRRGAVPRRGLLTDGPVCGPEASAKRAAAHARESQAKRPAIEGFGHPGQPGCRGLLKPGGALAMVWADFDQESCP